MNYTFKIGESSAIILSANKCLYIDSFIIGNVSLRQSKMFWKFRCPKNRFIFSNKICSKFLVRTSTIVRNRNPITRKRKKRVNFNFSHTTQSARHRGDIACRCRCSYDSLQYPAHIWSIFIVAFCELVARTQSYTWQSKPMQTAKRKNSSLIRMPNAIQLNASQLVEILVCITIIVRLLRAKMWSRTVWACGRLLFIYFLVHTFIFYGIINTTHWMRHRDGDYCVRSFVHSIHTKRNYDWIYP